MKELKAFLFKITSRLPRLERLQVKCPHITNDEGCIIIIIITPTKPPTYLLVMMPRLAKYP
jgi:hypothetical protein